VEVLRLMPLFFFDNFHQVHGVTTPSECLYACVKFCVLETFCIFPQTLSDLGFFTFNDAQQYLPGEPEDEWPFIAWINVCIYSGQCEVFI